MEFFRHCPACGRRFHVKLESKKIVGFKREKRPTGMLPRESGQGGRPRVIEGPTAIFDIEEFVYAYKCGHCGHEWSEKRYEEHRAH